MGVIARFIEKRSSTDHMWSSWAHEPTKSGVSISEESSMQVIAVYACINLLASDIASLPLPVNLHLSPRGSRRAPEHPAYTLLHDIPNEEQTSFIWRQTALAHTLLWGNCYSEIEFNKSGMPVALWQLPPWRVSLKRTAGRDLYYEVDLSNEPAAHNVGEKRNIPASYMFHVPAIGINGISGLSPIRQAMEAVGLAKAAEQFGALLFGQGANMGGIVSHPGQLSKQGHDNLETSLNSNYAGLGKSHRIMLLEESMKWEKAGIPPEEAQFLETRKFQKAEIASLFRIPPHMIGDTERSTSWGSGIEQQTIGYVQHTIRPWLVAWEQEIKRKILRYDPDYFAEFNLEGLLRGDSASRSTFYREQFYLGAITPNEIREKENMNPIPDPNADKVYIQANLVPIDKAGMAAPQQVSAVNQRDAARAMLADAVRRIAEREKQRIVRRAKEDPAGFTDWLEEFYRDFKDFIVRQVEPALGDRAAEYAQRYIEQSKRDLSQVKMEDIEASLANWEGTRPQPSLTGLM